MKKTFNLLIIPLFLFALAMTLNSCGSAGGDSKPKPEELTLSGTAATGAPIANATVTVKDRNGTSKIATTGINGKYTVDVTEMTAPFLLKVDMGSGQALYSVASQTGVANIHPFTDLIIGTWYKLQGLDIKDAFATLSSSTPMPTEIEVKTIEEVIKKILFNWLKDQDLDPATFNLITTPFDADGPGFDVVLEKSKVEITPDGGTVNISDPSDPDTTQTSTITTNPETGAITTNTTISAPEGESSGTDITIIPTTLAALAGTWEVNSLASGSGAPWWERGPITITSDGSFSGSLTESDGSQESVSGTLEISTDGIITSPSIPGSSNFRCSMDSGKTIVACTDTWTTGSPGTTEIKVWTKKAKAYSLADLAGTWVFNDLGSGPEHWWSRGTITIDSNGNFSGTGVDDDPADDDPSEGVISGTLNISPDGIVTLANDPDFRGTVDAGKTVMFYTYTGSAGSSALMVMTKKVSLYPEPSPDATSPALVASNPANGATNVPVSSRTVSFTFNEPMSSGRSVLWSDNVTTGFSYSWSPDQKTITYTYNTDFPANSTITWTLNPSGYSQAFRDLAGNPLPTTSGSFTTGGGGFSTSDLQGTWRAHLLGSGDSPDWMGWAHWTMSIDNIGNFTFTDYLNSSGDTSQSNTTSKLNVSTDGTITGDGYPSFHGVLSQDKDLIVATMDDGGGGYDLAILQKAGGIFSTVDLQGTWRGHLLASGDSPDWIGWAHWAMSVDSGGNFTSADYLNSSGDTSQSNTTGKINVSTDGTITGDGYPSFHGVLSQDKDLIVATMDDGGGGYDLVIFQKTDGTYSTEDIQGTWNIHGLVSGDTPQWNGWLYGKVIIDSDGTMKPILFIQSDGDSTFPFGPLHGVMSKNKDMLVATGNYWRGGYGLYILSK